MEKRIFTDEDRKKFAGLLPFAPGASVPFTPEAFESVEEDRLKPVFYMGPFSKEARKLINDHALKGTMDEDVMAQALGMEGSACRGWVNLVSMPDGEEFPYSPENIGKLPDWLFMALWNFAKKLTEGPTKEEKEALT